MVLFRALVLLAVAMLCTCSSTLGASDPVPTEPAPARGTLKGRHIPVPSVYLRAGAYSFLTDVGILSGRPCGSRREPARPQAATVMPGAAGLLSLATCNHPRDINCNNDCDQNEYNVSRPSGYCVPPMTCTEYSCTPTEVDKFCCTCIQGRPDLCNGCEIDQTCGT
jgi:hypothetical protein